MSWPASAYAHGESSPLIRTVVDRVEAPAPGVRVTTEAGAAAALRVANRGPAELEVAAPGGEPFLRIGPGGTSANVSSLYWYKSGNPDGVGSLPRGVPRGAPPRWIQVSTEPTWTWFEHRLHPAPINPPPDLLRSQQRQTLSDWSVPIRLDGRAGQIDGRVEFRPPLGSVVSALASPAQPLPGVFVALVPGQQPALLVQNQGRRALTVKGRQGEPFARIGRRGVEVNLRSPTHREDQRIKGAPLSGATDPAAPPRWRRVEEAPRYLWFDSRARYAPGQPPDVIAEGRSRTVLARWAVGLESSAGPAVVRGTTTWVPRPRAATTVDGNTSTTPILIGLATVVGLAAAGAIRLRRGRARARG